MVPHAAYLRVYEPLAAFTDDDREWLGRYTAEATVPNRHQVLVREHAASLARTLATPPLVAPLEESREAYLLRDSDSLLACPVENRLRCWIAISEFRASLPDSVAEAILPQGPTSQAEFDYAIWQADHPAAVPHILTSAWHVPAHWFVLFTSKERNVTTELEQRSVVYQTRMVDARRRVARAARTLRKAEVSGAVLEAVEDLGRWLEVFHPHGAVELDYGGLVHCVSDDVLRADDSPSDVAAAVSAIADGDATRAVRAYRRVTDRWEPVQARGHAS